MTGNIFTVQFRRKREGRTYYKKRMRILQSHKHRLVVRRSLRNLVVSVIEYSQKGDKVVVSVNSKTLQKLGWKGDSGNIPSAYLVGLLAGKKTLEKKIKEVVLDIGFSNSVKGSRLYAALAGAVDAGLLVPHDQAVIPDKRRLEGEHIAHYARELKSDKERYHKQFSDYIKKGIHPEDIVKHFNEVKVKIHG